MPSLIQSPRFLLSHCLSPLPPNARSGLCGRLFHRSSAAAAALSSDAQTISSNQSSSYAPLPAPPSSEILSMRESLLSRRRTAAEIAEEYLDRLRRTEPQIRSFLHVSETVMREAEEVDRLVETGAELGPLAGVLIGVKDNICTVDMPSTGGSRILEGYRPAFDATAVRRLKEAGAIVIGKTNLDEFGMGSTTEGSGFQVCS
ncbi:hypothetical protein BHM03_00036275 [Ensete ventricosum]|nr:hypothetical protein BHM03_00036275 [Ensete ventricosum]